MKKVNMLFAVIPLLALMLVSCSSKTETEGKNPPSAKEIVDKYTDTLVTSPGRARAVKEAVETKGAGELKELEGPVAPESPQGE